MACQGALLAPFFFSRTNICDRLDMPKKDDQIQGVSTEQDRERHVLPDDVFETIISYFTDIEQSMWCGKVKY